MVAVERIHQDIKLKLNKLDSAHNIDLNPHYLDDLIYEGLLDYIRLFYSGNNFKPYRLGFEVTQQRLDMLSDFVIEIANNSPLGEETEFGFSKYEFKLEGKNNEQYLHQIRLFANTNCGQISISPKQHDDISKMLGNVYQQPNANWKRLIATISTGEANDGTSLFVYSDTEVTSIEGKIIKKPNRPFIGGYQTLENFYGDPTFPTTTSDKIDVDISINYYPILVDIIVQNISGIIGDYNHNNYLTNKVLTN